MVKEKKEEEEILELDVAPTSDETKSKMPKEHERLETEETEVHRGEIIHRKRFAHEYTVSLSEKENQLIEALEKQLDVDSLKELLLKSVELLKREDEEEQYIVNFNSKQAQLIEALKTQFGIKDLKELVLALGILCKAERCPHCNLILLSNLRLCRNCGKFYLYEKEDIEGALANLEGE